MPASKLKLNLKDAQASGFAIPDDTYPAKIIEIADPKQGAKSSYVRVTFEITEGDYAKRKLFGNYMLDGKAAGMFVDLINKATGQNLKIEDLREEGFELDPDDLLECEVAIVTKQKEYPEGSGEMKSEISTVLASSAGSKKAESPAARRAAGAKR